MGAEPAVPTTDEKISVVIVEDHPLYRKGLRAQFETDPAIDVVGECDTAEDAVREVLALRPSVVVMDLRLPWRPGARATYCGAKAITMIRQQWPEAKFAVITTFDGARERVREAMKAGAGSFVSKAGSPHELIPMVRLTAQGAIVLHPEAGAIVTGLIPVSVHSFLWFPELSTRENEQLSLAAAGDPDRRIAEKLGISMKTVANYWSYIKQKLGVESKEEAVELARGGDPVEPPCAPGDPG